MANVIPEQNTPLRISLTLLGIGAVIGIGHFLLSILLARYVVDPLACGVVASAAQCASSVVIADGIATILMAIAGIFLGIRYGIARPLLVAAAAAVFMWGVSNWTDGLFWLEAASWTVILYALSYAVFGWINRYPVIGYVIILVLLAIIIQRIVLAL